MSDMDRALPAHLAGTTPTRRESIPLVGIEGLIEHLQDEGFVVAPEPPATGDFVLTSTDGVLSWEPAA